MTAIRWARPITTSMWCSTIRTVLPSSACTDLISSTSSGTSSIDTPAIGSSSRRTRLSAARSIASSSLRLSPCDSIPAGHALTVGETDPPDRPGRTLDRVPDPGRPPPDPHRPAHRSLRRQSHVLVHRQQRKDVRDLERAADARLRAAIGRLIGDVDAVELDAAARRRAQAGDEVEERRLPGPVRADHGEQLTVEDLEPDIGDDRCAADVEPEVPRREDRGCAHARTLAFEPLSPSSPRSAAPSRTSMRCR